MKLNNLKKFIFLFLCMLSYGCAGTSVSPMPLVNQYYGDELKYIGKERANLGLALSGGGTRSASFSIGVMKALQDDGILDNVDVISSVSGGSYASYWYFMQNFYLNRDKILEQNDKKLSSCIDYNKYREAIAEFDKNKRENEVQKITSNIIFADMVYCKDWLRPGQTALNSTTYPDGYQAQLFLQSSSNIMSVEKKPGLTQSLYNGTQFTANMFSHVLSIPLHWIANGVFDWNANLNPYRHYYQNGLERTYGYVPISYNLKQFANDYYYWPIKSIKVNAKDISFLDMKEYLDTRKENINDKDNHKLPYFIINATADYTSSAQLSKKKKMKLSVYEFTPWSCGSGLTGYVSVENCPDDISFGRAISISGAAVDGQNEDIDRAGNSRSKGWVEGAFLNMFNADLGYNIRNHNPDTDVWYYWPAKLIPFPLYYLADWTIGDKTNDIHLSDGGHVENLGIFSLVQRGVKKIIAVDGESDPSSIFSSLNRLKINLKAEMELALEVDWPAAFDVYFSEPAQSIVTGTIKGSDKYTGDKDIELVYIKLSVQKDMLKTTGDACKDLYPYSVVNYAANHGAFPQESTSDIFYSAEQYKAYRDLGYTIGKNCGDRCKSVEK